MPHQLITLVILIILDKHAWSHVSHIFLVTFMLKTIGLLWLQPILSVI
jgi:hypothetical protein